MTDKLIYLAFNNDKISPDGRMIGKCNPCGNRTFITRHDMGEWPVMECAVCAAQIGKFGWAE